MAFNFKYYMEHSSQLGEYTLGQLQRIVEEYPYFQIARILYLKNLYLLQNSDFECELQKSAPYIYNRPFLHDFLFVQDENVSIPSPEPINEEVELQENQHEEKKNIEASSSNEEKTSEAQPPEEFIENKQTKKNFSSSIKENISGLLNDQLKTAEREIDKLEINQLQMDVEKEYGKDLEKVSKKQETFILLDDDNSAEKANDPHESNDKKRISASISYAKDLLDFDYVLKKKNLHKTEKNITELLDSINKNLSNSNKTKGLHQDSEEQKTSNTFELKNQIIDNFIKTNPALKPEDKPFEFEDISTDSVKHDDNLITDTLARIYYNQGRYDKALEAYKKLSLKYPEKNSYFATQIEKIQNKLND